MLAIMYVSNYLWFVQCHVVLGKHPESFLFMFHHVYIRLGPSPEWLVPYALSYCKFFNYFNLSNSRLP